MAKKNKELSFEQGMEALDAIIAQMEKEDVSLESMLLQYEKGTALVNHLTQRLQAAQAKLLSLSGGQLEEIDIHE